LGTDSNYTEIDITEEQRAQIRFTGDGYLASFGNDSTDYWPRGGFLENVFIRHGKMIFHQKNFKPQGNLSFNSYCPHLYNEYHESFVYYIPFSKSAWSYFVSNGYHLSGDVEKIIFCKEVMTNIPLARKGYRFKDEYLDEFYSENTNWYRPKKIAKRRR
jgi:hypothetical protein